MSLKPCIECGAPSEAGRCPEHAVSSPKASRHARGYDNAWARLSKRARRLQPFCSDCGSQEDLTLDHSPQAWERHEKGLEIRLEDTVVVCRSCNGRRGRARPGRVDPPPASEGPVGKAQSALHTPGGIR